MRGRYNYIAVTVLHLSRREFYRMNPGIFFDMVQMHSDRSRPPGGNTEEV